MSLPRALLGLLVVLAATAAYACDLCSPPPPEFKTIQDELQAAATVVIADPAGEDMRGRTVFVIREVLRGGERLVPGESVALDEPVTQHGSYLLFGGGGALDARRPRRIDRDVVEFASLVARRPTLVPEEPAPWGRWLAQMVPHLTAANALIAASAGKEFADAPYAAIAAVRGRVDADSLLAALRSPETPARSRGALALLLGVCGSAAHADALALLLDDATQRAAEGHDALLAAYLMLRGPAGLPRLHELARERLDAGDVRTGLNVLAALRFHARNTDVLPRAAILAEVRGLLDVDALAPAAILELATLQDWESLGAVMAAYRRLRPKGPMVLGPAARYVHECPLPDAEAARAEVTGKRPETPRDEGD